VKGKGHFRITMWELPHVADFPAFNRFGYGPHMFLVLPGFAGVQDRSAVYHGGRPYITQSPWGWVSGRVFCELAEWFGNWVDACRRERGCQA
jgi:hypothetical protein